MILRDDFIKVMFHIRNSYVMGDYFEVEKLVDSLLVYFPRDDGGFSDIEHYCFGLDFGRNGLESSAEDFGELYDRLIKDNGIDIF